ncbi:MAG: hypothetical protein K8R54_11350 [Bacteroidales bacterium]|nr:hypothetical protein [Bacteroidales bacterium]
MISKKYNISFSIDDIEQLATGSSFERGEDYFHSGNVRDVVKTGNRFEGIVYGTQKYKVYLIDENDELNLNCNCPYDYGGICKHLVAFALTIIAGNYQESDVQAEPALSEKDFKSIYSKIASKKKLHFLKQLLDRDNYLKLQFIAFSKEKNENLDNIIGEKLEDVKFEINAKLSNIDFDDLRYDYDTGYGYGDYYDNMYDTAVDEIKNAFEPYINSIHSYIKKGNLLDAVRIMLGLYEGAQNLPELDNEDYVFDGEYNSSVQSIIDEYFNDFSSAICNIVKSDKAVIEVLSLIFKRIALYNNQDVSEEDEIICHIKDFEKLFHSLILNKETADFLYYKLQEFNLELLASAFIILNIAEVSGNEKLWIETAETYANLDSKITRQLLEKYHSKKLVADFNRIAEMAFKNWANEFDKFLIDNLDKKQQEYLYIKALKNYVSKKHSIKYYHILKTYFTKTETDNFINKFKDTYNTVFYVQLLEIEKRHQEILDCVNKNKESYEIEKLIKPIINIYPAECFSIIVEINNAALTGYKRDRRTYQTMTKTLKLLKKITSKKTETSLYLKELYNHKPNLPALKDEMRKADLITV